jgi:hypothetical protein
MDKLDQASVSTHCGVACAYYDERSTHWVVTIILLRLSRYF